MNSPTQLALAVNAAAPASDAAILALAKSSTHGMKLALMLDGEFKLGDFQHALCGLVRDVVAGLAAQPVTCRRQPDSDPFNTAPRRRRSDWPEVGTEGAAT